MLLFVLILFSPMSSLLNDLLIVYCCLLFLFLPDLLFICLFAFVVYCGSLFVGDVFLVVYYWLLLLLAVVLFRFVASWLLWSVVPFWVYLVLLRLKLRICEFWVGVACDM